MADVSLADAMKAASTIEIEDSFVGKQDAQPAQLEDVAPPADASTVDAGPLLRPGLNVHVAGTALSSKQLTVVLLPPATPLTLQALTTTPSIACGPVQPAQLRADVHCLPANGSYQVAVEGFDFQGNILEIGTACAEDGSLVMVPIAPGSPQPILSVTVTLQSMVQGAIAACPIAAARLAKQLLVQTLAVSTPPTLAGSAHLLHGAIQGSQLWVAAIGDFPARIRGLTQWRCPSQLEL